MKEITNDNTLLIEKLDEDQVQILEPNTKDMQKIKGLKIHRIVEKNEDGTFTNLTMHNPELGFTDISCLKDRTDKILVSVDKDKYNNFKWVRHEIGEFITEEESDHQMITIVNIRECDEDESKLLDEIYPEFRELSF